MRLTLRAVFETPVNVGGYGAPTFVDRAFRRDPEGWPFIPASSLKGRLRHECERLARALGCELAEGPAPERMGYGDPDAVQAIFGAPWTPGRIYPQDLTLVDPEPKEQQSPPPPAVRYNVSLSRQRRVAEDARLFTTELFMPGVPLTFAGTWEAEISLRELALLEAGLGAITALGRGKTGGLGWCALTVQRAEVQLNGADGHANWQTITPAERGRTAWEA
jgi:CRISPR/Cas system CSM-associated protein Csm3 (group 7 of RAMP superfamily)